MGAVSMCFLYGNGIKQTEIGSENILSLEYAYQPKEYSDHHTDWISQSEGRKNERGFSHPPAKYI